MQIILKGFIYLTGFENGYSREVYDQRKRRTEVHPANHLKRVYLFDRIGERLFQRSLRSAQTEDRSTPCKSS